MVVAGRRRLAPMEIRHATADDRMGLEELAAVVVADGGEFLSEYKALRILESGVVCEAVAIDESRIRCYVQAAWHRPVKKDHEGHWGIEIASTVSSSVSAEVVRYLIGELGHDTRWVLWGRRAVDLDVAGRLGLRETRVVHQLSVTLPIRERPSLPEGVRVTAFRVGVDEAAWLSANNAAFFGHPENGALGPADLEQRFAEPWFDPAGLRMAWREGRLVGSCWTKVHPSGEGEIYIIGVVPEAQGSGIGRALVLEGLRHLSEDRNLTLGTLWVEATNQRARDLYERLGFAPARSIRQFER